jgi:plasmid maintenance system antidote protein VapI
MTRKGSTMTAMLRKVIAESGLSYCAIELEIGIERASLMRFMRGEQSLRLDLADKLADYFGLAVVQHKKRR